MGFSMNILVVSKNSIPAINQTIPDWKAQNNPNIIVAHPDQIEESFDVDVIISMGVAVMEETWRAIEKFNATLYCYNWDCYEWVWTNPRRGEYDYKRYGDLLHLAKEIWVPSECTGKRTTQWWRLENWVVIRSSCPWWEHDNIRDKGYALCCLRQIPDPKWGQFAKACEELGIPYKMTRHQQSYASYQDIVAGCRFLVSDLNELSTGGLTLLEGYYHGKPCLLSDSPWHGGRDYMGDRATYFKHGDFEDFKNKLWEMYTAREPAYKGYSKVAADHKEYITTNFSSERMVSEMLERMS